MQNNSDIFNKGLVCLICYLVLISANMADFKIITSNYKGLTQIARSSIFGAMFDFCDKRIECY